MRAGSVVREALGASVVFSAREVFGARAALNVSEASFAQVISGARVASLKLEISLEREFVLAREISLGLEILPERAWLFFSCDAIFFPFFPKRFSRNAQSCGQIGVEILLLIGRDGEFDVFLYA